MESREAIQEAKIPQRASSAIVIQFVTNSVPLRGSCTVNASIVRIGNKR